MKLSQALSAAQINGGSVLFNAGVLRIYQGALPASPQASVGGATLLASWTFSASAFGAPVYDATAHAMRATASFSSSEVTPSAEGIACFARAFKSDGTTAIADFAVSAPWAASTAVVVGQYVSAGANLYMCTKGGATAASGSGPTGTGTGIVDGGAAWQYASLAPSDITMTSTSVAATSPQQITSVSISMPTA